MKPRIVIAAFERLLRFSERFIDMTSTARHNDHRPRGRKFMMLLPLSDSATPEDIERVRSIAQEAMLRDSPFFLLREASPSSSDKRHLLYAQCSWKKWKEAMSFAFRLRRELERSAPASALPMELMFKADWANYLTRASVFCAPGQEGNLMAWAKKQDWILDTWPSHSGEVEFFLGDMTREKAKERLASSRNELEQWCIAKPDMPLFRVFLLNDMLVQSPDERYLAQEKVQAEKSLREVAGKSAVPRPGKKKI